MPFHTVEEVDATHVFRCRHDQTKLAIAVSHGQQRIVVFIDGPIASFDAALIDKLEFGGLDNAGSPHRAADVANDEESGKCNHGSGQATVGAFELREAGFSGHWESAFQ